MRKLILKHLSDQRKGETLEFAGETLRIGRAEWNELVFADPRHTMVSRSHAEIVQRGNDFVLADANSSTGTFVNGEKITQAALKNGDILRFGLGGPEISVGLSSPDLKATVVVPPLQPQAAAPATMEMPAAAVPAQSASRPPAAEKAPAAPKMPQATRLSADEPFKARAEDPAPPRPAGESGNLSAAEIAALQAQVRRLSLIACAAGALLLVLAILAVTRVNSAASAIEGHAARIEKLDANTADIIQRLSTADTQGIQQVFEKKNREMEQRARQMERRAQEMEQKFQLMFDRKSREVDEQFELMGLAYPQMKAKMDAIRRSRKK